MNDFPEFDFWISENNDILIIFLRANQEMKVSPLILHMLHDRKIKDSEE